MALQISNYGELKAEVQKYLNKNNPEVVDSIPTFISLAERKMFRQLRCPSNEKIVDYVQSGSTPITTLQIPTDYLEAKLLVSGGGVQSAESRPLMRISEQQYYLSLGNQGLGRGRGQAVGSPRYFCRVGNGFPLYPIPDDAGVSSNPSATPRSYKLYYWADYSGAMDLDSDTTPILRMAPDLYLYGALLEAQPYIKNDERIAIWSQMFTGTVDLVNSQTDEAEYSGSNVGVSNAVNGAYGD